MPTAAEAPHRTDVFCDYLAVTYSPDASPVGSVRDTVVALGGTAAPVDPRAPNREVWYLGHGTVVFDAQSRWERVSVSGKALESLRCGAVSSAFSYLVGVLGSEAHTVTQLDVSLDESVDGAARVRQMRRRFPRELRLSHKPVPTRVLLEARQPDGVQSGTFYAGAKGANEVVAKVYDKAWELLKMQGLEVAPRARYEVSAFKGVRPCLADALDPAPLFWHYAAGTLLRPRGPVPTWERGRDLKPWQGSWLPAVPADRMTNLLRASRDMEAVARLATDIGAGGREWAIAEFTRVLDYHMGQSRRMDKLDPPRLPGAPPEPAPSIMARYPRPTADAASPEL